MSFNFTKERTPTTTTPVCKVSVERTFCSIDDDAREKMAGAGELPPGFGGMPGGAGGAGGGAPFDVDKIRACFFDDDIVFQSFCALRFWRWRFASLSLFIYIYIYIYIRARVVSLPLFLSLFSPARAYERDDETSDISFLLLLLLLFNRDAKNRTNARRPGD